MTEAAIQYETIPELTTGDASEKDLRRYITLWGLWIRNASKGYRLTQPCLERQIDAAMVCLSQFYRGPVFRRGVSITQELNGLQTKLFVGS